MDLERDKVARSEVAVKLTEELWERKTQEMRTDLEMRKQDIQKLVNAEWEEVQFSTRHFALRARAGIGESFLYRI